MVFFTTVVLSFRIRLVKMYLEARAGHEVHLILSRGSQHLFLKLQCFTDSNPISRPFDRDEVLRIFDGFADHNDAIEGQKFKDLLEKSGFCTPYMVFWFHYKFKARTRSRITKEEFLFGMQRLNCNSFHQVSSVPKVVEYIGMTLYAFTYFNSGDNPDLMSYYDMLRAARFLDELWPENKLVRTREFIGDSLRFHDGTMINLFDYKCLLFYDLTLDVNVSSPLLLNHVRVYRSRRLNYFQQFWNEG